MSLRIALQLIGLLFVALLVGGWILAMGPIGWVVFGTMLAIGFVQVYRQRRRRHEALDAYCANCGSEVDVDAYETERTDQDEWRANYCTHCGAPVTARPEAGSSSPGRRNCPDCGAPNDPAARTCTYCNTGLSEPPSTRRS